MTAITRETKLAMLSNLSVRLHNALIAADILTVEDLLSYTSVELEHIPNIGKKTFTEVRELVRELQRCLTDGGVGATQYLPQTPAEICKPRNVGESVSLRERRNAEQANQWDNYKFWLVSAGAELSSRAHRSLNEGGMLTLGDVAALTKDQVLALPHVGNRTAEEILDFVQYIRTHTDDIIKELGAGSDGSYFTLKRADYSAIGLDVDHYTITLFKRNGFCYKDLNLSELGLSARAINTCNERGITLLSELLGYTQDDFAQWGKLGTKTITEILDLISNSVETHYLAPTILNKINLELLEYEHRYATELQLIARGIIQRLNFLLRDTPENSRNIVLVAGCFLKERPEPEFDPESLRQGPESIEARAAIMVRELLAMTDFVDFLVSALQIEPLILSTVVDIVDRECWGMTLEDLAKKSPRALQGTCAWSRAINEFRHLGPAYVVVEKKADGTEVCRLARDSIFELIENIVDAKHREMLKRRLDGDTLDEIGRTYGVSRERIRQIVQLEFSHMPPCRQDRYVKVFSTYDFKNEEFCQVFQETPEVYNYLDFRYGRGELPLRDFLADDSISVEVRKRAEEIVYRNYVIMPDGVRIECIRPKVVIWALRHYAVEECTYEDFLEQYSKLLDELGLGTNEALVIKHSQRYENNISSFSCVLWKTGRLLRYYNYGAYDFTELLTSLNLEQYHDVEYSTERFFLDNTDLMARYDIRDKNELHNLLRKIYEAQGNTYIRFRRMPTVEFGQVDRDLQVYRMLEQLAPVSADDFASFYNAEYGFDIQAIKANYLFGISKYLHDGLYQLDQESLPPEQLAVLKRLLKADCYDIDEVRKIYLKAFPKGQAEDINTLVLRELGFKVYISYIIRNSYQSITDYFKKLTDCETIDITSVQEKILLGNIAELRNLRASYRLIQYAEKCYAGPRYLLPRGLTAEYIEGWINNVADSLEEGEVFTVASLRRSGRLHPFDNVEFGDMFYVSILKETPKFGHAGIGGDCFFRYGGGPRFSMSDAVRYVVEAHNGIALNELSDLIESSYLIKIDKYRLAVLAKSAGLYVSRLTKQVYMERPEEEEV